MDSGTVRFTAPPFTFVGAIIRDEYCDAPNSISFTVLNMQECVLVDPHEMQRRFTYHTPKPGQPEKYEALSRFAHDFAEHINKNVPDSREKSLAFTALEESVMWANAAIARNE